MDQHDVRPGTGSVFDDKITCVASVPLKSLGSRVNNILPWVELDGADVCLLGDA